MGVSRKRPCAGVVCLGAERTFAAFPSSRATVCKRCTRERVRRTTRATRLMAVYGITLDEYDALLKAQGGKCAGCEGTRSYNLHVDHDHKRERELVELGLSAQDAARGSIRGLLCARCNKLLRDSRDNVTTLRRLAAYVLRPPARRVLR